MQAEALAENACLVPAPRMSWIQAIILDLANVEDGLIAAGETIRHDAGLGSRSQWVERSRGYHSLGGGMMSFRRFRPTALNLAARRSEFTFKGINERLVKCVVLLFLILPSSAEVHKRLCLTQAETENFTKDHDSIYFIASLRTKIGNDIFFGRPRSAMCETFCREFGWSSFLSRPSFHRIDRSRMGRAQRSLS